MKAPLREQLKNEALPEDELSDTEQQLLRTLLDRDLEAQWAKALAEKGIRREPPVRRLRTLRVWMAAAAAVLLLGIVGWWLWDTAQLSSGEMAAAYLPATFLPGGDASRDAAPEDPDWQDSYNDYKAGRFQEALTGISFFINTGKATVTDHILAGLCYMQLPQPDYAAAIRHLLEARRLDNGNNYTDNIHWMLGLAYTLSGNREKALEELKPLLNSSQSRDIEKARTLIEKLEKE